MSLYLGWRYKLASDNIAEMSKKLEESSNRHGFVNKKLNRTAEHRKAT